MNLNSRIFTVSKNTRFVLLCVWLIAMGNLPLLGRSSVFLLMALNNLAMAAGVLLLLEL